MQICPQCQHVNPAERDTCEQCDASLTHKRCHECGASVAIVAESCTSCGTRTGSIWWAAIAGDALVPVLVSTTGEDAMAAGDVRHLFLNAERRYRLMESKGSECPFEHGAVQDMYPLAPVPLRERIARDDLPPWLELYLHIVQECQPALPNIRDAWETAEQQRIMLFEDRSNWSTLRAQLAIEPPQVLQILAWMAAAIGLWEPLAQSGCAQSLLEESNLRIDEDLVLGLQQLYEDRPGEVPTLAALGALWKDIFGTYLEGAPKLTQLLQDTADGVVDTLDDFYDRLEVIAYEQEGNTTVTLAVEDFEIEEEEATVVLPMQLQSIDCIGLTDVGRKRTHNEDFFFVRTGLSKQESPAMGSQVIGSGLYIVCDGMGGHAAGEVASEMAADTLREYIDERWQNGFMPDEDMLRDGIFTTNNALFQANQEKSRSGLGRMGTTLVMTIVQGTRVAIAHVGDSRAYRLTRRGGLEQLTTDHEVGQRHIQRGVAPEIAYAQPDAYQLTQAVGPRDNDMIAPDVQFIDIDEDTILLLCSDGLSDNYLLEEHYETYLLPLISSKANLRQGMEDLIDFANQHNGHDNITGVLVRIKVAPAIGA